MIRPVVVLGKSTEAADLALRRVLRFKECPGPLIVLDWIGRGAPLLHRENEGRISKRPVTWCDLADRRRPLGLFGFQRSDHLHSLLSGLLVHLRELTRTPLRDEVLSWAADVGSRLADEGTVGLAAWYQALRRPEVKRWFPGVSLGGDERDAVARLLGWALRFSGVYAVSEAPNRVALPVLASKPQTTWIEVPLEHFESVEHTLVSLLVELSLWDAVWRARATVDPKRPETVPTILQFFPVGSYPGLAERLKTTTGWTRHVGVFTLSPERSASPTLKDWIEAGADLWVLGGRDLPTVSLAPWLDEAVRRRLSSLGAGDLWARSGSTGRAVVVKVGRHTPAIPLPWRFRLYASRRRRASAVGQMSTAVEHGGRRAGSLYDKLCDRALLRAAWLRVAQGRPESQGVDGVTIARFKAGLEMELDALVDDLESRRYSSRPLRRVLTPKASGGQRELRISCVRDRVVQTACLALLEPIFEPTFSHFSFAFRPRRSAHHAVALARSLIASGCPWAVTADIERCFDSLDHEVLVDRVARRVSDPLFLALLRHWLTADVLEFRDLVPMDTGVPQGSPISPLLANVYLDPLDRHFEERRLDFVRYADDILVFARDEPLALEALHALGEFLHEPLHLTLKPAKTDHVRVDDGLNFLGFRLTTADIRIQPEKLDRVTSSLHASISALGAPHATFLERTRMLGRINALVRGFRAYFGLPNEPPIAGQLRHLDRVVDQMAQESLPAALGEDPAWLSRERFTGAGDEDEPTVAPAVRDVYPEEGPARAPLAWMVKRESRADSPPPTPPAALERRAESEDDASPARSAVVEHEGRVYVTTHGSYVTDSDGALVVKRRRVEIYRRPLAEVRLVFLQGLGTSLSLSLALQCAKRDVTLVVAPLIGAPVAVLNPLDSTRSHLRGRQVLRRNDPDVVRAGLHMLAAKVGNQAAVLRYFAKYRLKTDVDLHRRLVAVSANLRQEARRLGQLDPVAAGVRASAMGLEGHAAAMYWTHLAALLPAGTGFNGRVTRDAVDPVNQAINYVYGMLYGEVWRALVKAGMDPYFGIMHGSERDQGSLVFDLIEEFRAPFADRLVVAMIGRGLKLDTAADGGLRSRSRRMLAHSFIRAWTRAIRWRGKDLAPATILERQAGALAKLIAGDADYHPFRMRW